MLYFAFFSSAIPLKCNTSIIPLNDICERNNHLFCSPVSCTPYFFYLDVPLFLHSLAWSFPLSVMSSILIWKYLSRVTECSWLNVEMPG